MKTAIDYINDYIDVLWDDSPNNMAIKNYMKKSIKGNEISKYPLKWNSFYNTDLGFRREAKLTEKSYDFCFCIVQDSIELYNLNDFSITYTFKRDRELDDSRTADINDSPVVMYFRKFSDVYNKNDLSNIIDFNGREYTVDNFWNRFKDYLVPVAQPNNYNIETGSMLLYHKEGLSSEFALFCLNPFRFKKDEIYHRRPSYGCITRTVGNVCLRPLVFGNTPYPGFSTDYQVPICHYSGVHHGGEWYEIRLCNSFSQMYTTYLPQTIDFNINRKYEIKALGELASTQPMSSSGEYCCVFYDEQYNMWCTNVLYDPAHGISGIIPQEPPQGHRTPYEFKYFSNGMYKGDIYKEDLDILDRSFEFNYRNIPNRISIVCYNQPDIENYLDAFNIEYSYYNNWVTPLPPSKSFNKIRREDTILLTTATASKLRREDTILLTSATGRKIRR